jgi:hypothetical protein
MDTKMTIRDKLVAAIRTAAAGLGTLLIAWILKTFGVDFPDDVDTKIQAAIFLAAMGGYNVAVNWLTERWKYFGFLLAVPKQPVYDNSKPVLVPDSPPAVITTNDEGSVDPVSLIISVLVIAALILGCVVLFQHIH